MNVKNIISFAKKIEQNNERFHKLSPAKQRVAIAKDAMAQLLAGGLRAVKGVYLTSAAEACRLAESQFVPECMVCAKGAVFLSAFRLSGSCIGLYARSNGGTYGVDDSDLLGSFDEHTLRQMERTFERWDLDNEFAQIGDADARLYAILENIIENDGEFKPRGKSLAGYRRRARASERRFRAAKDEAMKSVTRFKSKAVKYANS